MRARKPCFVISPIGEPESETRKRSDQILRHIIRPAAEICGYEAVRADEINEPGIITSQVIQRVVDEPLVVADLTERNPNVFYELAVRHATRKPLVQIISKGENIPFDVAVTRTIFVDLHDLDSAEIARNEIIDQIKSLETDSTGLQSPISVSLDLQRLRQSENPEQRSLADLLSEISSIRNILSDLSERATIGSVAHINVREMRRLEERLSSKLEEAIFDAQLPHRQRSVDPSHIVNLARSIAPRMGGLFALPVLLSCIREDAPWIYEVGMEVYRQIRSGEVAKANESKEGLLYLIEFTVDTTHGRPDLHILIHELRELLVTLLTRN